MRYPLVIRPGGKLPPATCGPVLYLAGTMHPWRSEIVALLAGVHCVIVDPLPVDWPEEWSSPDPPPAFDNHVSWEIDALTHADLAVFCFAGTGGQTSMFELGLVLGMRVKKVEQHVILCAERAYVRYGYLAKLAADYHLPLYNLFGDLVTSLRRDVGRLERRR